MASNQDRALGVFLAQLAAGERAAQRDELVWGDALERIGEDAGADIVKARSYLELLLRQFHTDPHAARIDLALKGVAASLLEALYKMGRYRANPMVRRATLEEKVASRWLEKG
jgi:hypothetical protein